MILRKGFARIQPVAVVALPLWLLVGFTFFGSGVWTFIAVLFGSVALFVALAVVTLLSFLRQRVRATRSFDWVDVGVFAALDASAIGLGFFGPTASAFAIATLVIAIAGFWTLGWMLVRQTTRHVASTFAAYSPSAAQGPVDIGDLTVIEVEAKHS